MIKAVKLSAAIDAAIKAGEEEPFRKHLGASIIGDECARKVWYNFHWTLAEDFEPRLLRLFNRGHETEPRFIKWLRAAGVTVWEAGESGDSKAKLRISAHEGHFGGTPDGIGHGIPDIPNEYALLEFKTHNDKSFKKLVEDGLMKSKWKHFVQMQVYMHFHKLQWGLYCANNKDTDACDYQLVQYDEREATRAVERAGAIIWATEPPGRIGKNPAHYGCKFCHLQRLCYFGDVQPARNCRTCRFSRPGRAGEWICGVTHSDRGLNEAAQRAACPKYQTNSQLQQPA